MYIIVYKTNKIMTLKEKFSLILMQFWASDWEGQCEKVADEFAIGFAEWSVARAMGFDSFKLNDGELEVYKKEKGL